ncbi:hypothetical protein MP638_000258 [Amoeboaphelidium occidentale]|nr:hypothetical protein MP638_000258 [Amoeboaphelidium occidentale]
MVAAVPLGSSHRIGNATQIRTNLGNTDDTSFPTPGDITYMGGLVVDYVPNVYIIFYGDDFVTNGKVEPVMHFANGLQNTGYLNHLADYTDNRGARGTTRVNVQSPGFVVQGYPLGKQLGGEGAQIADLVKRILDAGHIQHQPNNYYFVALDKTVTYCSGTSCFPNQICGAHGMSDYRGQPLGFGWGGDGDGKVCDIVSNSIIKNLPTTLRTPNAPGVDGLAHVYAHELVEFITDPMLPCPTCSSVYAWADRQGLETADKCAYFHGGTQKTQNGFDFNIMVGNRPYLIQQDWNRVRQTCNTGQYFG